MIANSTGTWDGTLVANNGPYIPPRTTWALRLSIETQSEDHHENQNIGGVSPITLATLYGHVFLGGWLPDGQVSYDLPTPMQGFVDHAGVVKISVYEAAPQAGDFGWTLYAGQFISESRLDQRMSGTVGTTYFGGPSLPLGVRGSTPFSVQKQPLSIDPSFRRIYQKIP